MDPEHTSTKRRGKATQDIDGWVQTDAVQLDDELPMQLNSNDPGKPWPRESTLVLGQLVVSLVLLLVGDVLFAGYNLGIFGGLICWAVALLGLVQNSQSRRRSCLPCYSNANRGKNGYGAVIQLAGYILAAIGLLALASLQLYYLHLVESDGTCVIRLDGSDLGPGASEAQNQRLSLTCEKPEEGSAQAFGQHVGCTGCLCMKKTSDSDDTCTHECISTLLEGNVCGSEWRLHISAYFSLVGFGCAALASVISFVRVFNLGLVALTEEAGENDKGTEAEEMAEHPSVEPNELVTAEQQH